LTQTIVVDPLFWLGLSILFVAVSLTAVLVAALPALRELARASRSAEKLFDTLSRELPPTLEAIRLTGMEISDLTDDVSEGVQSAGRVVKQFDESVRGVKKQAKKAQATSQSLLVGFKAAWKAFRRPSPRRVLSPSAPERSPLDLEEIYSPYGTAAQDYPDGSLSEEDDSSDYYSDMPLNLPTQKSSNPKDKDGSNAANDEEYYHLDPALTPVKTDPPHNSALA
jgi:uncharacterized protein YoxC